MDHKQMPFLSEKINSILNDGIFNSVDAPLAKDIHLLGANNKPSDKKPPLKEE